MMRLSAEGKLRLAARLALTVGVGALAQPVFAQEAAAPAQADQAEATPATKAGEATKLQGVQVTGSRIKSKNLTSNSPVTVVGSQELKAQGTTRVEDLINNLPQAFADQGGNISNGASGTATVNLRNLGSSRTLVLIDGKRLNPGDPQLPSADLNFIPAQLIDHVDVLTGGASAVYGSDALAGVVNFVLKKDFEGVEINYQRSGYLHDNNSRFGGIARAAGQPTPDDTVFDGGGNDLALIWGVNSGDGKGNATLYATYRQLDPVTQAKRDFSACTLAEASDTTYGCSGSSTSFPGRFRSVFLDRFASDGSPIYVQRGPSYTIDSATGNLRTYTGADSFNFGPFNYYQRNDERYTLGGSAHYQFNRWADAYSSVMFADDRTDAVIAPSGIFFGIPQSGVPFSTPCTNPFLNDSERLAFCGTTTPGANDRALLSIGRRNVEGGGRDDDLRHTSYRIVSGLKGEIVQDWSYDVSLQYAASLFSERYLNDFSSARTQRALDVVTNPATGEAVCRSVLDGTDPSCVPYNIFQLGGVTPQALAYLQTPGLQRGSTTEQIASGSVSGSLGKYGVKSPFAEDGVGLSFGGEYRREALTLDTDTAFTTGDLAGQGSSRPANRGAFAVKELYTEVAVPLAQHLPLIESLSVTGAYRYSEYSQSGNTNAYKIDGEWAPVNDIRFRGGYNRAVRAPNTVNLFDSQRVALDGSSDPCAGEIDPDTGNVTGGATREQCALDPVIAANPGLYGNITDNPAAQYNGLVGGSNTLKPEKADTYTAGFVFTPTFAKAFQFSLDYYQIKVKNLIGGIGADNILNACYNSGQLCDRIHRDGGGSLWLSPAGFVDDITTNAGSLDVRGIDVTASYRLRLADFGLSSRAGQVLFDFVGTRDLRERHDPTPGLAPGFDCQGRFGFECGTPVPLWRHKLRATYSAPTPLINGNASFSVAWRYISHVEADELSFPNELDARLGSRSYVDLTASITYRGAYTFRLGVNNVFDKDPPVIGSGALPGVLGNGNTFPQVYDALGRYLFAGVTVDF